MVKNRIDYVDISYRWSGVCGAKVRWRWYSNRLIILFYVLFIYILASFFTWLCEIYGSSELTTTEYLEPVGKKFKWRRARLKCLLKSVKESGKESYVCSPVTARRINKRRNTDGKVVTLSIEILYMMVSGQLVVKFCVFFRHCFFDFFMLFNL